MVTRETFGEASHRRRGVAMPTMAQNERANYPESRLTTPHHTRALAVLAGLFLCRSAEALSVAVRPPPVARAPPPPRPEKPNHFRAPAPYVLPEGALAALAGDGFVVVEDWLSAADADAFRGDAMKQRAEGRFVVSKVGSRKVDAAGDLVSSNGLAEETRAGETCWLRPPPPVACGDVAARRALNARLEDLRVALAASSGAALLPFATELGYAFYETGGFYKKHVDVPRGVYYELGRSGATNFALQERREYSVLLYLNPRDWDADRDGGALVVDAPGGATVAVSPRGGTLVVMSSDRTPHEVLASKRPRLAVVGWFRTRRSEEATRLKESEIFAAAEAFERFGYDAAALATFRRARPHLTEPVEVAYCFAREAHALFDGLDDRDGAAAAWREAEKLDPGNAVSLLGLAMTTRDDDERPASLAAARKAEPESARAALLRAASLEIGDAERAELTTDLLRCAPAAACLAESLAWLDAEGFDARKAASASTAHCLKVAAAAAARNAGGAPRACAEFGIYHGRSLRLLDAQLPDTWELHGFDSFVGLPEAWAHEAAGSYSVLGDRGLDADAALDGAASPYPARATLHRGWFADTAGPFAATPAADRLGLVHLDCDLYSSARDVLLALGPKLAPGCVVVFDDFLVHATWREDEKRAWDEAVAAFGLRARVIAASLLTKQVVFELL